MLLGIKEWMVTLFLYIVPLYVKSPVNCYSNEVNRYNESSTWKMRLDISDNEERMKMYKSIWKGTEEQLNVSLESVVRKDTLSQNL